MMKDKLISRRLTRRDFLRFSGWGALTFLAGGAVPAAARQLDRSLAAPAGVSPESAPVAPAPSAAAASPPVHRRLVATDGYIHLPGRDPLYIFGFREVEPGEVSVPVDDIVQKYKGRVQTSAPILAVDQDVDLYLTVTNIGLVVRPDLDDAHTLHWHGFRNPTAIFDGVPEVSLSVPPGRDFPYFFRPRDPGTYMYHCHFEDVEHVQMGMNGIVYVRPIQNFTGAGTGVPVARLGGNPASPILGYTYNDGDGITAYDREFTLMLNEIDTRPHDLLEAVQEFIWTDYKANYWVINGRAYPDTVKPGNDPSLVIPSTGEIHQPISSLIQANPGDRVLLRFANLGYEQHAMQLPGIRMKVVGHDATLLRGPAPAFADLTYETNTVYIGPGEARDVLFTAPAYDALGPVSDDGNGLGPYNTYWLKNRNYNTLNNGGSVDPATGLGGMVTEVRVYQNPLPPQTEPNETYP